MTKKTFEIIRLIVVVILALMIGASILLEISFIAPLAIIVSAFLINYLFHRVNETVADERDYKLSGQSAQMALNIVSISLTVIGMGLIILNKDNLYYYKLGNILLYIVCFILVVNIFAFLIYQKRGDK